MNDPALNNSTTARHIERSKDSSSVSLLVDAQVHIWAAASSSPFPGLVVQPTVALTRDVLDLYLNVANVDSAVLVQPINAGQDHQTIKDAVIANPRTFAGVCTLPTVAEELDTFFLADTEWFTGLRIRPRLPAENVAFATEWAEQIWRFAADNNKTISVLGNSTHSERLAQLAAQFPDVPVVLDHLLSARPDAPESLQALKTLGEQTNMYAKISGLHYLSANVHPHPDMFPLLRLAVEAFSPDRLLWSSDFPHGLMFAPYDCASDVVNEGLPELSAEERSQILGSTAHRLYWRD